jgi:aspartate racemase
MPGKSKHIGIVACSVEGAALCFQEIAVYSRKRMGEHLHPQVTLSCIAMGEWLPAFDRGDHDRLAEFMLRETEIVAKAAVRDGYRHAALLGTRFTMRGPVYPEVFEKYALKVSSPAEGDQKIIDDIIFKELVNGIVTEASRLLDNDVIDRMGARGCDCVILGCTEIPLLVRSDDCPLATLDSTRLLARAAVDAALT